MRAAVAGEDRSRYLRSPVHPDGARLRLPVRAGVGQKSGGTSVRTRLIVAFIVVALLAALASAWLPGVILPFFPSLHVLAPESNPLVNQLITALHHPGGGLLHP